MTDNGWQDSADAWIADQGDHGDFGRRYVLDPVMLPRAVACAPQRALDVGCGEGRFCRMLRQPGIHTGGPDPAPALPATARARSLPFPAIRARTSDRLDRGGIAPTARPLRFWPCWR